MGKGLSLFANKKFIKGDKIIYLKGELVNAANSTPEAVQMTTKKFIDTKYLVPEDFINHSCSPNTKLDTERRWFIAIKDIFKNQEITFNYLTTEWDMKNGVLISNVFVVRRIVLGILMALNIYRMQRS